VARARLDRNAVDDLHPGQQAREDLGRRLGARRLAQLGHLGHRRRVVELEQRPTDDDREAALLHRDGLALNEVGEEAARGGGRRG